MAVSGAKSGEQKVEVCRSLNTPFFFVAIRSMVWVDLSILDPSLGVLWSTEYMWEYVGMGLLCHWVDSLVFVWLWSLYLQSLFLGKTNPKKHQAQNHMACFRLVPMEHLNSGLRYTLLMILTQLGIPLLVWHSVPDLATSKHFSGVLFYSCLVVTSKVRTAESLGQEIKTLVPVVVFFPCNFPWHFWGGYPAVGSRNGSRSRSRERRDSGDSGEWDTRLEGQEKPKISKPWNL